MFAAPKKKEHLSVDYEERQCVKLDLKKLQRKRDFWPSIEQNFTYQTHWPFNPHLHSICLFQKLCHRDFFGLRPKNTQEVEYKITKRMCSTQTLHLRVFIELLWSILIWIHLRKTLGLFKVKYLGVEPGSSKWPFWVSYLTSIWVIKSSLGRNQKVWRCVDQLNDRTIGKEKLCQTATPLRNKTLQFEII